MKKVGVIALGMSLLAVGAGVPLPAVAQTSAFDFTGPWTGQAQRPNKPEMAIGGDLTATGNSTFTASLTVQSTAGTLRCTGTGREKPNLKVRMRLRCGGTTVRLRGTLDPGTATVSGHFTSVTHGKIHTGTFSLTKQAA
jgi:hypothetical protein